MKTKEEVHGEVKKGIKVVGVSGENAENRIRWKQRICCGEP